MPARTPTEHALDQITPAPQATPATRTRSASRRRVSTVLTGIALGAAAVASTVAVPSLVGGGAAEAASRVVRPGTVAQSLPGIVRVHGGSLVWYLRDSQSNGAATTVTRFGARGDIPVVGDWDGDGDVGLGVVRKVGSRWLWLLRNDVTGSSSTLKFFYGLASDRPLVGDWDGNGTDTPGVARAYKSSLQWHLRDRNSSGPANRTASYGSHTDQAVVGDWDGNGTTTIGIARAVRGGHLEWRLRNATTSGPSSLLLRYGRGSEKAITGDWNGDRRTTVGVLRDGVRYLRNSPSTGRTHVKLGYGRPSDYVVTGDWRARGVVRRAAAPPAASRSAARAPGSAAELARAILANPRVQLRGSAVRRDLQLAAAGRPSTAGAYMAPAILRVVHEAGRRWSIGVSGMQDNRRGHSATSRHYLGKAVDISRFNGVPMTGRDAGSQAIARLAFGIMPAGSGIGQSNCGGGLAIPRGWNTFRDTCHHLHLQMPR